MTFHFRIECCKRSIHTFISIVRFRKSILCHQAAFFYNRFFFGSFAIFFFIQFMCWSIVNLHSVVACLLVWLNSDKILNNIINWLVSIYISFKCFVRSFFPLFSVVEPIVLSYNNTNNYIFLKCYYVRLTVKWRSDNE